jgi:hypothetical protein
VSFAQAAPSASEADAYDIGVEAYTYLYPLVLMDVTRRQAVNVEPGQTLGRAPMNTFAHFRAFPPAEFRDVVRPNFDTLYSTAWLDLTKEPVVVSAPDTQGRYYMLPMLDMWTDVFAVPGKRTTGTGAGKFAIVPPGWRGTLPAGVQRIDSPTPYAWIIGRTQTNGPADYAAVNRVQDGYTVTRLSQLGEPAQPVNVTIDPTVDMKTPPMTQVANMNAGQFFSYAAELLKVNPPHVTDQPILARMRLLGIEPGKSFDFQKADPAVQRALERAAPDAINAMRAKMPTLARTVNGWQLSTDLGAYGNNYLKRAAIALFGLGANLPEDAIYPINIGDADGNTLHGSNRYVLHFEKNEIPPVTAFWSVTLYDKEGFPTANALKRNAIGDRDALKFNEDGSLDIHVQHESPGKDKESNWLPAPADDFNLLMRLYGPKPAVVDGSWVPPPVRKVATAAPVAPRQYKMTTQWPVGIAMPDEVKTRLGTLKFFDGFPDDATVEKLYDNLDFQRAVQAYLLGLPPVSQVANRKAILAIGPANKTVPTWEKIIDPRSLFLTPNNNTPYSWAWLDLREGPLVLEVPPKVLGLVNDMWYNALSDLGFMGPDKGEGGKYLLLPPGYKGEVPPGYFVIRPASYSVWVPWRSMLVNGDPKPGVDAVKALTKIYPLSEAANPPKLNFVDITGRDFNSIAPADYQFWAYLNQVVQEEPTDSLDPVTLGLWASIGIQKGKPFNPDARMKKILEEAASVGDATARAINYRMRAQEAYFYPDSAWRTGFLGGYKFQDNGALILDSATAYYFYATGVTPAMDSRQVGQGSQYMAAFVDSNDKPFDGGRSYKLHLPPNIPVANFWSVILYDNQTRSMLQTDQHWPAAGSQTKGLVVNPDSSVDVYFGPKPPPGMENNWVQTVPGKGWNVVLRLYGPLQPWFDKTWRPGEITLVE